MLRGGPVLIRGVFPERDNNIGVLEYFPEAARGLAQYPTVAQVSEGLGFAVQSLEAIPQVTAPSLQEVAARLRREAHTLLMLLTDEEFSRGLKRLRHDAATTPPAPVIDYLDFLVLK